MIIGAGPAGLTAAIYAGRAKLDTLVIGGTMPGGQIYLTYQVDNYPGFPEGVTGPELVESMISQVKRFGATIIKEEPPESTRDTKKVPICELCNDKITTVSTACPYCGREFHKDHWQAWIRKHGECPVCREQIKVINP